MAGQIFTILQHTILDILVPTVDVFGDINFAYQAFSTQYYGVGCMMMFPVLLSIIFNFYKWFSTDFDTDKEKRYTWLLVILCMWPQYQVIKLLLSICHGKSKVIWNAMQVKIKTQLSFIEPFVEAIPELFISVSVFSLLVGKRYRKMCPENTEDHVITRYYKCVTAQNHSSAIESILSVDGFSSDDTRITELFGRDTFGVSNNIMFPLSFSISLFSGIKSIVDYLHNGPLKMNSNTNCGRAVVSLSMVLHIIISFNGKLLCVQHYTFVFADMHGIWGFSAIFIILIAVPLQISIFPLARVVGFKRYTRMVLKHPEVLMLPLVTEYVPGPIDGGKHYNSCCRCCKWWRYCTWSCCCKGCEVIHTNKVVISKEMSWAKMLYFTVVFYYGLFNLYINTKNMGRMVVNIIGSSFDRIFFGITLHYGKSKGVLVIENMGDIRAELKEELELRLQKRLNLEV